MKKGKFGYLARKRRLSLLKSVFLLAIVLAVFFVARHHYGTNRNVFSILAAVGALPAGRSIVVTVMCMRARGASEAVREAVQEAAGRGHGGEPATSGYDLCLTSYDGQFSVSHMAVRDKRVIGYMEMASGEEAARCRQHVADMLDQNGLTGCDVRIFRDLAEYTEELADLLETGEQEGSGARKETVPRNENGEFDRQVMQLLYAVSL